MNEPSVRIAILCQLYKLRQREFAHYVRLSRQAIVFAAVFIFQFSALVPALCLFRNAASHLWNKLPVILHISLVLWCIVIIQLFSLLRL